MQTEELKALFKTAESHYHLDYLTKDLLNSPPALAQALKRAQLDTRWDEFKKYIKNNKGGDIIIHDRSTYAISTACFKIEITLNLENGKRYIVIFYISIIADYYAYKISEVPGVSINSDLRDMLMNEKDHVFVERLKAIFSREKRMRNLSVQNEELKQALARKKKYREILEKEQTIKQNRIVLFNECDMETACYVEPILSGQEKIFGYRLFDKNYSDRIVNGVKTNLKKNGEATLFDCIFTDFDDLHQQSR